MRIHQPERGPYFNPRAYVRHDLMRSGRTSGSTNFNPRAYVRHDADAVGSNIRLNKFQSTCLREARRYSPFEGVSVTNFNPRAYVRHDP